MSEREDFYDQEIAPSLLALCKRCQDRGISFAAKVEWEPGESGTTAFVAEGAGIGMLTAAWAAEANGNADSLIMAMMKHAHEHGHNSACLHLLGVYTEPEAAKAADAERGRAAGGRA